MQEYIQSKWLSFGRRLRNVLEFRRCWRGYIPSSQSSGSPIHNYLSVSLEDVLYGTTKKMRITRHKLDGSTEEKVLTIDVRKGWKSGTRITFPREGDERPNTIPADIIFTVKDRTHKYFKRDGADVSYVTKIGLRDALCGVNIQVPTIDGRTVPLRVDDCVIKPGTTRRISGQGLPYSKEPNRRGDILAEFEIVYPDRISASDKEVFMRILPQYKRDPATAPRGGFWLLGFPPGPLRPSLDDLETTALRQDPHIDAELSTDTRSTCTHAGRNSQRRRFQPPGLQVAGLQAHATTPSRRSSPPLLHLHTSLASLFTSILNYSLIFSNISFPPLTVTCYLHSILPPSYVLFTPPPIHTIPLPPYAHFSSWLVFTNSKRLLCWIRQAHFATSPNL
nr:dnaJ subfamily B [Hymenolepis microstoma]